jgi:hypothetical protein
MSIARLKRIQRLEWGRPRGRPYVDCAQWCVPHLLAALDKRFRVGESAGWRRTCASLRPRGSPPVRQKRAGVPSGKPPHVCAHRYAPLDPWPRAVSAKAAQLGVPDQRRLSLARDCRERAQEILARADPSRAQIASRGCTKSLRNARMARIGRLRHGGDVADGKVDFGFVPISQGGSQPRVCGAIPPEVQLYVVFSSGIAHEPENGQN